MYDRIAGPADMAVNERWIHSGRMVELEREVAIKDDAITNMGNWLGSQACEIESLTTENICLSAKEGELKGAKSILTRVEARGSSGQLILKELPPSGPRPFIRPKSHARLASLMLRLCYYEEVHAP